MQDAINTAVKNLTKVLKSKDWNIFDEELRKIEDINIYDKKYEETILTELLHEDCFYKNGALMPEVIKHFLVNGYDVLANEGANGGLVLSALCWSSYDKYVLESAKALFNAGAPLEYKSSDEDDEFAGVIGSLEWKIPGAWGPDCDYAMANTLEAYYVMAKAYEAIEEYRIKLNNIAENEGLEKLYNMAMKIDPEAMKKISINDKKRIIRVLEIFNKTGKTKTEQDRDSRKNELKYDYKIFVLNMDREVLYDRINRRVDLMIKEGLVEEVENIIKKYDKFPTAMQGLRI